MDNKKKFLNKRSLIAIGVIIILLLSSVKFNSWKFTNSYTVRKIDMALQYFNDEYADADAPEFHIKNITYSLNDSNGISHSEKKNYTCDYRVVKKDVGVGKYLSFFSPIDYEAVLLYKWKATIKDSIVARVGKLVINGQFRSYSFTLPARSEHKIDKMIREIAQKEINKDIELKLKELSTSEKNN